MSLLGELVFSQCRPSICRWAWWVFVGVLLAAVVAFACSGDEKATSGPLPSGFDPSVYPDPVPFAAGVSTGMSSGCPDQEELETRTLLRDQAVDWINDFLSGDNDVQRRLADRAYWSMIVPVGGTPSVPVSPDRVEVGPADSSPLSALLTNACGSSVVERSQWVRLCPGPCETTATTSPSLVGNFFLISRKGHWLVWAAE